MPDEPLQVILLDGPLAGFLVTALEDAYSYVARVPRRLTIGDLTGGFLSGNDAYYCLHRVHFSLMDSTGVSTRWIRVGTIGTGTPSEELLDEMCPTGLAEQGVIPWHGVRETAADVLDPIPLEEWGNPLKSCSVRLMDPFHIPVDEIDATCACGWRTGFVPLARRSQLVRTAYKHADPTAQHERRRLLTMPIRVIATGSGITDACLAGGRYDEISQKIRAECGVCGWRTEDVEPFRHGPLSELWKAHRGANGVRHARNRLLTAYGLPIPDDEDGSALT